MKHGETNFGEMVQHIETVVHQMIRVLYPWLRVYEQIFSIHQEGIYKLKWHHYVVKWELSITGSLKCNTNGTTKGNVGPNFVGFVHL